MRKLNVRPETPPPPYVGGYNKDQTQTKTNLYAQFGLGCKSRLGVVWKPILAKNNECMSAIRI